jgi:hypothetical protein
MKFKLYFFILLIPLFGSCINNKDYKSVGTNALDYILKGDTIKLKNYFLGNPTFNYGNLKNYIELYRNKKYEIVKIDTSSVELDSTISKYLEVYYKIDESYHRFQVLYELNKEKELKFELIWLNNLSKECEDYLSKPFEPTSLVLQFPRIAWTSRNKILEDVTVRIQNGYMNYDIDTLKFRIKISLDNDLIINRTVICDEKIHSGDFIDYKIKEISNLYVGKSITKENLRYETELIESLPHPESDACSELIKLKAKPIK